MPAERALSDLTLQRDPCAVVWPQVPTHSWLSLNVIESITNRRKPACTVRNAGADVVDTPLHFLAGSLAWQM